MIEVKLLRRFNLVDESWIPIAGDGLVSLARIFSDPGLITLGGNPVQKIAMTKLLLAIAQAACTPENTQAWSDLAPQGLAQRALDYLQRHRDDFWLYGDKPFLQIPAIALAASVTPGALFPYIATGNTTVLTQIHQEQVMTDAEKALLIVQALGFSLGGKKTDNSVVLSHGYRGKTNEKGKPSAGRPGASLGYLGFMHHFLTGENLWTTLWFNLLTHEDLKGFQCFSEGLGDAPWINPPTGEDCPAAKKLRHSLMGKLLPFSRFVLLGSQGLHYSDGIVHLSYKEGGIDPSLALDHSTTDVKVVWIDPHKKTWRHFATLLSFLDPQAPKTFRCPQITLGIQKIGGKPLVFGLWAGGLRVSNNAGEQFVAGFDDYVEAEISLEGGWLTLNWISQLTAEMFALEEVSKILYVTVCNFYKNQKADGEKAAILATDQFWEKCEPQFQNLIYACLDSDFPMRQCLRPRFAEYANQVYDTICTKETARQIDSWAKNQPVLTRYLLDDRCRERRKESKKTTITEKEIWK